MAILNKNNKAQKYSFGDTFERLEDTVFGGKKSKINKENHLYSNDFIDVCIDDFESETGINKQYAKFHDSVYCDSEKNTDNSDNFWDFLDDDCDGGSCV